MPPETYAPGVPAEVGRPMVSALSSLGEVLRALRGPARQGERERLRMLAARLDREMEAASAGIVEWGRVSANGESKGGGPVRND